MTGLAAIVPAPRICYYQFIHGLRFPKPSPDPLLLSPVEHLRRVYVLVSDSLSKLIL